MVTFAPDALIIEKLVAAKALTQLNLMSLFARACMGDYESGAFELGKTVSFRRPRYSDAQEYDPRTGNGVVLQDPGYVEGELVLEKLFTNGFPIYSSDYNQDTYTQEYSTQIAFSLTTVFDRYLYNKFRLMTHAPTGAVAYAANAPIAMVANETPTGELRDFDRMLLIHADTTLERENVPPGGRVAILSSSAKGAYIGEAVPATYQASNDEPLGARLLQQGLPIGAFVDRHGFAVGGSNVVGSQLAVADLDSSASNQPDLAISLAEPDDDNGGSPFFTKGDYATLTSLGAIVLTLGASGNLQNVAVGHIARIGATGATAKAYGIVLRVDVAGKRVWVVPFSPKGLQLSAVQIDTATDRFSIPNIPSISVAFHQETVIYATRQMKPPSGGSGAIAVTQVAPQTNIVMQIWRGSYDITRFREGQMATLLTGAKLTDYRKCCLMLSL